MEGEEEEEEEGEGEGEEEDVVVEVTVDQMEWFKKQPMTRITRIKLIITIRQ